MGTSRRLECYHGCYSYVQRYHHSNLYGYRYQCGRLYSYQYRNGNGKPNTNSDSYY